MRVLPLSPKPESPTTVPRHFVRQLTFLAKEHGALDWQPARQKHLDRGGGVGQGWMGRDGMERGMGRVRG